MIRENTYDKFINLILKFCNWHFRNTISGTIDPQFLFMVDDGWLHLSGYINLQNTYIWGT